MNNSTITAFSSLDEADQIIIPNSVTGMDNLTNNFKNNNTIKSISFEEGSIFKTFGETVFNNMGALKTFIIPDTVEDFPSFSNCNVLDSVIFPEYVSFTTINNGPPIFNYCPLITTLSIPEGITTINRYLTNECITFDSIIFPKTFTNTGSTC